VVEREAVLERLGWRFVSLRASQYYRQPQEITQLLLRRLRELGVEPAVGGLGDPNRDEGEALYQRILDRASQLRRIWRGEEENMPAIQVPKHLLDVPEMPVPPPPMPNLGDSEFSGVPSLPGIPSLPNVPESSFSERMAQRLASLSGEGAPPLPDALPPMPSMDSLPPMPPSIPSFDSLAPLPPLGPALDSGLGPLPSIPSSLSLDLPGLPSTSGIPEVPQAPGWKELFSKPSEDSASFLPLQLPDPPKRPDEH